MISQGHFNSEDKENEFKRPPRLPQNQLNQGPLSRNASSSAVVDESLKRSPGTDRRSRSTSARNISVNRNRGRSATKYTAPLLAVANAPSIDSERSSDSAMIERQSRLVDSRKRHTTLPPSSSRGAAIYDGTNRRRSCEPPKNFPHLIVGSDNDKCNNGEDDVACTPQVTRHRSKSGSRRSSCAHDVMDKNITDHATNAPKKKIRTHSKQHLIKKHDQHESIESLQMNRSRSHSRTSYPHGRDIALVDGERKRGTRSTSSSGRMQTYNSDHIRRARSLSTSRGTSLDPTSFVRDPSQRPGTRSHSRSSYVLKEGNRSRGNSLSSNDRQRRRSISKTRSVSSGHLMVEPNVHHNAIVETEIQCPVISEMKENELYAIQNGINLITDGDHLNEAIEPGIEDMLLNDKDSDDNIIGDTNLRRNQFMLLSSNYDYPHNASVLCHSERESVRIIGSNTDLAQLKLVAGQLCLGWGAKEYETPSIARRIIDFNFAQMKRRKKFGNERPWGILGLYDHLSAVRMDVEWAEMVACRRANGEPYKAWFEFVDERSTGRNRPFFTIVSLCICAGFLMASIAANGWTLEPFSVNPMLGPSAETLVSMGAKDSLLIVQKGEVWRIISAMVLHAGLIHFVLNMLALWFVGKAVEQCHGFFPSMLLFVVPGIGGTILSAIFLPNMVSVGASGGIFGLIGACLADIYMNWGLLFNKFVNGKNNHVHVYVLLALLADIIVNSLIGLTPFVDNFTHLGGMIFGFICGTSTMQRISTDMFDDHKKTKTFWTNAKSHFVQFLGIIVTLIIMIASFTILMQGDGVSTPCKSCKVFSCVEFPPWAGPSEKWWYCDECAGVTADARINPQTKQFDRLSLNCPHGDVYTMDIQSDMNTDREWLEKQLPKWCRAYCVGV